MHWTKLKKAVEEAGGIWTNKEDAAAFLAGQGVAVEEPRNLARIDWTQPYGEIIGEVEGAPSARYSQGGKLFNKQGEQVG